MKNKLLIVLFILVIFAPISTAVEETKFDFRTITWGMNEAQVKETERSEISEIENGFAYKGKVVGLDCKIIYQFVENKLYVAGYIFTELHTNYNLWIDDYQKIKELLIKKYGKPIKSDVFWASDLYKKMWGNGQNFGTAVSMGYLTYYAEWDTPKTKIWVGLKGDNFVIDFRIIYESKELKEWSNKILQEKEQLAL